MRPLSATTPAQPFRQTRNSKPGDDDDRDQAAADRQVLRERAARLLANARTLTDVASRTGLVIEAALLHRLATVGEEQVAALRAWDPEVGAEMLSFASRRARPRLN